MHRQTVPDVEQHKKKWLSRPLSPFPFECDYSVEIHLVEDAPILTGCTWVVEQIQIGSLG